MKSTIKYRHDVFIIENAMTRTREGDRWLVIHDLSNTNIVGYIKDGSLIPMHSVPATEGITVNYVDKATNRPVKSVIVPFAKSPKQAGMNLKTSFLTTTAYLMAIRLTMIHLVSREIPQLMQLRELL